MGAPARAADFLYVVQPGDHLWNIAQRYLQHPAQALALLRQNRIADERLLMPGTQLRIPHDWLRLQSTGVRLLALAGEVSVQPEAHGPRPAVAGEWLQAPAMLRTGANGSASLQFSDGSRVLVLRESELRVSTSVTRALDQASIVALQLLRGGLENDVRPRKPQGGRFQIQTPAAIAAVRGTRFRVHADNGAIPQTRTEVLSGAVQVSGQGGDVTAHAAQGSVARLHEGPQPLRPLLPAPDLSALPAVVERMPFELAFPPLDGAMGYRVQLAPGADFDVTLLDETTPTPHMRLAGLANVQDGRYVLRVRGIDAQGLEGRSDQQPLELRMRPEPPLLIDPAPGATISSARPLFHWTENAQASGYRLQVSLPGDFVPFIDSVVPDGRVELTQDLPPGAYQWRVASVRSPQHQGPFSDPQSLRRVLPGPVPQSAVDPDGAVVLRWSASPEPARYRLQVAGDAAFTENLLDVQTDTPQYTLQSLTPGLHHVRVQTLHPVDGASPWGAPQTFTVPEPGPARWPALLLLLPLVLL